MIMTIHGVPASGKSKTVEWLLRLLGNYSHTSTGAIARKIALEYGFSEEKFDTFPKYARDNNIPYDQLIDNHLKELNNKNENIIVDSRLGYFFIPDSFKVLLNTPLKIAARRMFKDPKRRGKYQNAVEVYKHLLGREQSDRKKYLELYDTDYTLKTNFDFVIPTTFRVEEVANMIFVEFGIWCAAK